MIDPYEEHHRRSIKEHVVDFRRQLEAKGNTKKHARQTCNRAQAIADGCKFERVSDLSASGVVTWLAAERAAGRMSILTSNYYLRDFKSFLGWMVKDHRMGDNPLAHVCSMNAAVEKRLERRALEPEDFAAFVEAASHGKRFRELEGSDRAVVYTLAAYTGFRERELASLTPASFDLEADPPTVTAEAAYSKRRRQDVQPLRPDVAQVIRAYIAGKPADRLLWPGTWVNKGAEMVRRDLAAAGCPMRMALAASSTSMPSDISSFLPWLRLASIRRWPSFWLATRPSR
jgi:integrase